MKNERFHKGLEQLCSIDGTDGEQVIKSLEDISPDLGRFIVEFAFGDIYTRPGLTLQERELITITSLLTAGGCEAQLDACRNRTGEDYRSLSAVYTIYRISKGFECCICC